MAEPTAAGTFEGAHGLKVPAGAWDTHVHILNNPPPVMVRGRAVPFPHAPADALDAMLVQIGVDHAVIVDGALGGTEVLIGQLEASAGRYRGVALVNEGVSDADLQRLHAAGVRGARFYFVDFMGPPQDPDAYRRAVDRIARLGWHALVFLQPKDLIAHEKLLRETPVPIILDHMCEIDLRDGLEQPAMALMLDLQSSRDAYIKVSCGDRRSLLGAPDYADDIPFARKAIDNDPARVVWGTDWPHVLYKHYSNPVDPMPDDRDLMRLALSYCRSQAEVDAILRDNPARLYG